MFNFASKKYLVTGAGRGLGRAIAKTLSERGSKVYALSLSKGPLEILVSENPDIVPISANVGNWEELREKLKDIEVLDGLVNNAAATKDALRPCFEWTKDLFETAVNVNLLGAINATQVIAKKMVDAKRPGSIVNISSVTSLQAHAQALPYVVSKAGLDMATKQFALELGPYNIRVNSVNPTLVLTDNVKEYIESGIRLDELFLSKTPMKRLPEVSEVVEPILYLLSDQSSMVNGTINIIDGGMMSSLITEL